MKALAALLLWVGSAIAQQPNWLRVDETDKDIIYIVSTRPLADIYSHPLASKLVSVTDDYVYGMYLSRGNGVGTSSEQSMHTVALDLQNMTPKLVIVDDVVASNYLMKILPAYFDDKTLFISRSNLNLDTDIERNNIRIENVAKRIVDLVSEMNMFPDTYYILYDDSGLTASEASFLKKELSALGAGTIKSYEVSTIQELDDLIFKLNKNQKGIIINTIMSLVDSEFGRNVRLEKIKQNIVQRNVRHLEIGFSYLPDAQNESIILELNYGVFVDSYFLNNQSPQNIKVPFKVILNKSQMYRLGMKRNYIAAHESIDLLVE